MTGLDKIVGEIEQESKDGVSAILGEARQKAEGIAADAEKAIAAEDKEIADKASARAAAIEKQAEDGADIIKRRSLLSTKQEIIAETLDAAKKKLYELPDSEYADFIEKLRIHHPDCISIDATVLTEKEIYRTFNQVQKLKLPSIFFISDSQKNLRTPENVVLFSKPK